MTRINEFFLEKKKKKTRINGWYNIIESKPINLNFGLSGMTFFRVIMAFEWNFVLKSHFLSLVCFFLLKKKW